MKININDVELRTVVAHTSKTTQKKYFVVHFETDGGVAHTVMLNDVTLVPLVTKGAMCNMTCELNIGSKFTSFELIKIDLKK